MPVPRSLHSFLRVLSTGLLVLGSFYYAPIGLMFEEAEEESDRLQGPPPGHPERLVPHVGMDSVERALWGQLSSLG